MELDVMLLIKFLAIIKAEILFTLFLFNGNKEAQS
jgi:hypothetical protein